MKSLHLDSLLLLSFQFLSNNSSSIVDNTFSLEGSYTFSLFYYMVWSTPFNTYNSNTLNYTSVKVYIELLYPRYLKIYYITIEYQYSSLSMRSYIKTNIDQLLEYLVIVEKALEQKRLGETNIYINLFFYLNKNNQASSTQRSSQLATERQLAIAPSITTKFEEGGESLVLVYAKQIYNQSSYTNYQKYYYQISTNAPKNYYSINKDIMIYQTKEIKAKRLSIKGPLSEQLLYILAKVKSSLNIQRVYKRRRNLEQTNYRYRASQPFQNYNYIYFDNNLLATIRGRQSLTRAVYIEDEPLSSSQITTATIDNKIDLFIQQYTTRYEQRGNNEDLQAISKALEANDYNVITIIELELVDQRLMKLKVS